MTVFDEARRFLQTLEEADHLTPEMEIMQALFILDKPVGVPSPQAENRTARRQSVRARLLNTLVKEAAMTTSQQYRSKALESAQLARQSKSLREIRNFIQAERSYTALAENEEWLAVNTDKLVPAEPSGKDERQDKVGGV